MAHRDEHALVVSGSLTIRLSGEEHVLESGAFVAIPCGAHHAWGIPDTADAIIFVKRNGHRIFISSTAEVALRAYREHTGT